MSIAEIVSPALQKKMEIIAVANLKRRIHGKCEEIDRLIKHSKTGEAILPSTFCSDQEFCLLSQIYDVKQLPNLKLVFKRIQIKPLFTGKE